MKPLHLLNKNIGSYVYGNMAVRIKPLGPVSVNESVKIFTLQAGAESTENKANSAKLELELGLSLTMYFLTIYSV